jgi:hypothetical protein
MALVAWVGVADLSDKLRPYEHSKRWLSKKLEIGAICPE